MSSGINAMASLILQDFIVAWKPAMSQLLRLTISKFLVFGLGVAVMGISLLVTVLESSVVSIGISISGALGGPIVAVFTLGAFFPWANAKGAAFGQVLATAFLLWVALGNLLSGKSNPANLPLPVSIEECPVANNQSQATIDNTTIRSTANPLNNFSTSTTNQVLDDFYERNSLETTLYALSNNYYPLLALLIIISFGLLVSFLTGANDTSEANPNLFIPMVDNKCLPEKVRKFFRFGVPLLKEVEDQVSMEKDKENFEKKDSFTSKPTMVFTKL